MCILASAGSKLMRTVLTPASAPAGGVKSKPGGGRRTVRGPSTGDELSSGSARMVKASHGVGHKSPPYPRTTI